MMMNEHNRVEALVTINKPSNTKELVHWIPIFWNNEKKLPILCHQLISSTYIYTQHTERERK